MTNQEDASGVVGSDSDGRVEVSVVADHAMTRSEERLSGLTRSQAYARARLRTYITTEMQTITVPIRREYAVLESVPYDDELYESASDTALVAGENVILLNEEVADVVTTVRPVARVRLEVRTRTVNQTITSEVRQEHIVVEGDVQDRRAQHP